MYVKRTGSGNICIITTYVDDLLIAASTSADIIATKDAMSAKFAMKDLGLCTTILGIDVVQQPAGGVVTWRSKKVKSTIPQSTAKAELYALNSGICKLLKILHIDMPKPTPV
ncbi:hypothetical protein GGI17_006431 [Coemansia sp. S146]|nr:hypothetical protein GGI17_006431 [Coemansia sp. S146]